MGITAAIINDVECEVVGEDATTKIPCSSCGRVTHVTAYDFKRTRRDGVMHVISLCDTCYAKFKKNGALMVTFGEMLVSCRKAMGLNQRELGKKLGISQVAVSYLENGKRRPSYETLDKLQRLMHPVGFQSISGKALLVDAVNRSIEGLNDSDLQKILEYIRIFIKKGGKVSDKRNRRDVKHAG